MGGADDSQAIVRLVNLYGFAVDTQRWDLFDRIFTPDVEADFGGASHWRNIATWKRDFAVFHDPFDGTQHAMMNHLVEVDGDTAHAMTCGTWRLIRRGIEGGDLWFGTGWYDDRCVRTADGWRIAKRVCRVAYWDGNPLVNETIAGVKFETRSVSLRREAESGRVDYMKAIAG